MKIDAIVISAIVILETEEWAIASEGDARLVVKTTTVVCIILFQLPIAINYLLF